jgi:predicted anti-sigma-YlaC factor YlaD
VSHDAHLVEERLFDHYIAARGGEPLDPPVAEHLTDCRSCATRYADLASFMDGLSASGAADADSVFTADRLRAQHLQIARRLEQVGRPARVISFPGRVARATLSPSSTRWTPRWIAGAAAAGLFVGVAVGASYNFGGRSLVSETTRQASSRLTPVATRGNSPAEVAADDAFLSDLELALERPHTRELQAFDALTPHVREVSNAR